MSVKFAYTAVAEVREGDTEILRSEIICNAIQLDIENYKDELEEGFELEKLTPGFYDIWAVGTIKFLTYETQDGFDYDSETCPDNISITSSSKENIEAASGQKQPDEMTIFGTKA